jgi:hypothetical protein
MKRICHHYKKWEDYHSGMYHLVTTFDSTKIIDESKNLLSCSTSLYIAMKDIADHWNFASEHNLTDKSRNRQAWLGQAACCKACNAKEGLTKKAWHLLSSTQQDEANAIADIIIDYWEATYFNKQKQLFKLCPKYHLE